MKTLLLILLCAITIYPQHLVAEINGGKFFVYEDYIFPIGDKVLFGGKYEKGRVKEISSFLVNCKSHTFVKLSFQRQIGKTISNPPFKQEIQVAKRNSAMYFAIVYVCNQKELK